VVGVKFMRPNQNKYVSSPNKVIAYDHDSPVWL